MGALHRQDCRHREETASLFTAQGSTLSQVKATGPWGLAGMQAGLRLSPSTHSAQCSPVQQERLTGAAFSWPLPSVPSMSPACPQFPGSLTPIPSRCGKGQMKNTSQPAIGTEGALQLFNLGRAQRGQGCTAGTPVVAKPLHGLLQPRDPEPAGDLWEGGHGVFLAPMGQHALGALLCRPCSSSCHHSCPPHVGLQGWQGVKWLQHPMKCPLWGEGAEHTHIGLYTGALWHVGLCSRDRLLNTGMRSSSSPPTHTAAYK